MPTPVTDPYFIGPVIPPGVTLPTTPPTVPPTSNTPQQQFNWMQLIGSLGTTFASFLPQLFPQAQQQPQFQQPVPPPRPAFDPTLLLIIGASILLISSKK